MRERTRTLPAVEVDGRASVISEMPVRPSLVDSHDDPSCQITTPEREHIFADLQVHNDILRQHEQRLDEIDKLLRENSKSMPVTVKGPKGISVTGNWRTVVFLAILASLVAITYIALPYFRPVQTQERGVK